MSAAKLSLKENESEARERLRAFWAGSSLGRPALHITCARPGYSQPPRPHPGMALKEIERLPEYHVWNNHRALEGRTYLAEAMPKVHAAFAGDLALVALCAGGDYEYEGNNAWIKPIDNLWERPLPRFDPGHPVLDVLGRCMRELAAVAGGRAYLNTPALLDGLTILSMFRSAEQLCMDVVEDPDRVREWSDAIDRIGLQAHSHLYGIARECGSIESSSWLPAMAEGSVEAVQCDFAVMLSPDMFQTFVLPALRRATGHFDYSLYHLDGVCQMRFLDQLATLENLNGIQWNPEPQLAGGRPDSLPAFKEIRSRKLSLMINCRSVDEAVFVTRELGPDGLYLAFQEFATRAEAENALKRIQAAC